MSTNRRRLALAAMLAVAGQAAAAPAQHGEASRLPAGRYQALSGERYRVTWVGSADFRVENAAATLCLDFARRPLSDVPPALAATVRSLGLVHFVGAACTGAAASQRWTAAYAEARPGRIILYPPNMFSDRAVAPLELRPIGPG